MCTCTDIIEAISSSIIISFRYECLQIIQAESPGLYTETHIHNRDIATQTTEHAVQKHIQMLTEIIYNHACTYGRIGSYPTDGSYPRN